MRRITLFAVAALALLLVGGLVPVPSHAQQHPAQTLVGQSLTACKTDTRFRFPVVA